MEFNIKVSEIGIDEFKSYQRIDDDLIDEKEKQFISICIKSAISYIKNSTNLCIDKMDSIECFNMAVLMIASDFYENRSVNININSNTNKMVTSILSMNRDLE